MRLSSSLCRVVLALALASGCSASGPTEISGDISVTPTAAGLVVANRTEQPVYLMAIERGTTVLVDWIPCTGGDACPALAQGESRTIAWSTVLGYAADRPSYVVYWWHLVTAPDGSARAGPMRNVVVTR